MIPNNNKKSITVSGIPKPRTSVTKVSTPAALPPDLAKLIAAHQTSNGNLPLIPGNVMLLPEEAAALKLLGHKDGDPIPANIAELIAKQAAADEQALQGDIAELLKKPPVSVPEPVDINSLPEARIAELKKAMQDAANMKFAPIDQQLASSIPGMKEAISAATSAPIIVDDFSSPAQDNSTESKTDDAGGANMALSHCPRCRLDLKTDYQEKQVTHQVKLDWLTHELSQIRFEQSYSLYNNSIVVVFRSLTTQESDSAFRQVALDGIKAAGEQSPETEGYYWRNLQVYRMTAGLATLITPHHGIVNFEPVFDWEIDPTMLPKPHYTKLYAAWNFLCENYLTSESLRRTIGDRWAEFDNLCAFLESKALDDSFWQGIGQPS